MTSQALNQDGLDYVKRPECKDHGLPDLAPTAVMVTEAGEPWTCPECGRIWTTVIQYATGAQLNTIWQSTAAPGHLSPLGQRVAALETSGAASAQSTARVTTLENKVAALQARTVIVERALPVVAAIALGAKLDLAITWQVPFPDTAYRVEAILPAALIGKATAAVKTGSQTVTGVTITLTAVALVAAGSVLDVTATRYA